MEEIKGKVTAKVTTKAKAPTKTAKSPNTPKKKSGVGKGKTNNPNGRPKGSKNKVSFDIRAAIFEKVSDVTFIKGLFTDIKNVGDIDKRAKLKLELVKLFVPRPMNEDEATDRDIKSLIFDKLSGKVDESE